MAGGNPQGRIRCGSRTRRLRSRTGPGKATRAQGEEMLSDARLQPEAVAPGKALRQAVKKHDFAPACANAVTSPVKMQ